MADDRIRISWDDVQSTQVDDRIRQQAAIVRSAQQLQQFATASPEAIDQFSKTNTAKSLFYNAMVYMAFFGCIGGVLGWGGCELVMYLWPNPIEEFQTLVFVEEAIQAVTAKGEISENESRTRIAELYEQYASNPYLKIILDQSLTGSERDQRIKLRVKQDEKRSLIQQFLFFAVIAVPLAFWLSIGDQVMSRNWTGALICGSVALSLGLLGGGLVSLFINKVYQSLGGGGTAGTGWQMLARSVGWSLLGAFMTIAPGIVMRNFKRLAIGLAGGLIGGLVGGALFDPLSTLTDNVVVSRFVAVVAIGVLAGVGTGVIENAAKSGWLKVVTGLISGKQFILYRNPTIIGSSPQCEIYLFKDPLVAPHHAAIHLLGRGFEIVSLPHVTSTLVNGNPVSRARLRQGDQIGIGGTVFIFQEKDRSQ